MRANTLLGHDCELNHILRHPLNLAIITIITILQRRQRVTQDHHQKEIVTPETWLHLVFNLWTIQAPQIYCRFNSRPLQ